MTENIQKYFVEGRIVPSKKEELGKLQVVILADYIKAIQFWKEKCEFAQKDSKARIKDQVELNETIEAQAKVIVELKEKIQDLEEMLWPRNKKVQELIKGG